MAVRRAKPDQEDSSTPTGPMGRVNPVMEKLKQAVSKKLKLEPLAGSYGPRPSLSTGSFVVNALIGGDPAPTGDGPICFGFPRKGMTEIFGSESCGKTTLCLSAVAATQKEGGTVVYLDFEHAVDHTYAKKIGVNFNDPNFVLYAPTTMEDGLTIAAGAIASGIDLVVIDSVAAMVPQDELAKGIDENAKVGAVAKKLAETLPKFAVWLDTKCPPGSKGTSLILINQMRASISTGGGGGYGGEDANVNTAGGKALKYYYWLRLKLTRIKSETIEKTDVFGKKKNTPFGNVVDCKIVKTKVNSNQGNRATFFIRYGQGVDDIRSLIEVAEAHKIVKKSGAQYTFGTNTYRGKEALRKFLLENEAEKKVLYDAVLKAIVLASGKAVGGEDDDDDDESADIFGGMGGSDDEDSGAGDAPPEDVTITEALSPPV